MPAESDICRDFERGVCDRGTSCKYFHPDGSDDDGLSQNGNGSGGGGGDSQSGGGGGGGSGGGGAPPTTKLPICKDYQNKGCDRRKCKFLHITHEEESVYKTTGQMPDHKGRPHVSGHTHTDKPDLCKDFLNGKCDRGSRCKYFHVKEKGEVQQQQQQQQQHVIGSGTSLGYGKRTRPAEGPGYRPGGLNKSSLLMEENNMLRQNINELQQEITNLKEMNETLQSQNSRYCIQIQRNGEKATNPAPTPVFGPVAYPQYSQPLFPLKAAVVPQGQIFSNDANSYSFVHY